MRNGQTAFTLVELMVVIAIIVVLLALLTPAMDRAIYQAELAACGAKLKGIAHGGTLYAVRYQRRYPGARDPIDQPSRINGNANSERRPALRQALGDLNQWLGDPLTGAQVDFDQSTASFVIANYSLFFNWGWNGHKAMRRVGDRFTWNELSRVDPAADPVARSSDVLASDRDVIRWPDWAQSGHPDTDAVIHLGRWQDDIDNPFLFGIPVTAAMWFSNTTSARGLTDDNFAFADGSVRRFDRIEWNEDPQMARAPDHWNPTEAQARNWIMYLPK